MRSVALVTVDTENGFCRRYTRVEGNKPVKTGDAQFNPWDPLCKDPDIWARVRRDLEAFRVGYNPAEEPPPRPTNPPAIEIAA